MREGDGVRAPRKGSDQDGRLEGMGRGGQRRAEKRRRRTREREDGAGRKWGGDNRGVKTDMEARRFPKHGNFEN